MKVGTCCILCIVDCGLWIICRYVVIFYYVGDAGNANANVNAAAIQVGL